MTLRQKGKNLNCQHCGLSVYIPFNRLEKFKFCSRKCLGEASKKEISRNCDICGTNFTHLSCRANTAKYCSKPCYYKAMTTVGTVEKSCLNCSKKFMTSPSKTKTFCCKSCVYEYKVKNFESYDRDFGAARNHMKKLGLLEKCQECGFSDFPEIIGVHHIDENRSNNKLSNLVALCANCHSIQHMRHVPH